MGWIAIVMVLYGMVYDTEIRCALGNKGACVELEKPRSEQKQRP